MKNLTEYEKGFAAGLIDGEGCFKACRGAHVIAIMNTNFALLLKAQSILGGSIYLNRADSEKHTACWRLQIMMTDWKDWLNQVLLVEKETPRQEFLKHLVSGRRRKFWATSNWRRPK